MASRPASKPARRNQKSAEKTSVWVSTIHVKDLFGKLSYRNISLTSKGSLSNRVSVLYGDNGTGKTTILRLVYACLSPQTKMGLRTLLASTPFSEFSIEFSNGMIYKITKEKLVGSYRIDITGIVNPTIFRIKAGSDLTVRDQEDATRLEKFLRKLDLDILFVDHNRVVKSTYSFLSDLDGEDDLAPVGLDASQYLHLPDLRWYQKGRLREDDLQFPLPQMVEALEKRFRAQAFRQGAAGDQSAAAVYIEIVRSITRDRRRDSSANGQEVVDVSATLHDLKEKTISYIKHGLLSDYPFDELISLYSSASKAKKIQIESVLNPFLDSIKRRVGALTEIHEVITKFETEIRKYFQNKKINFHILEGLKISDSKGNIDLDSLSSGEKQLVFLLCAAAIARERKSLILIDEPELSLNYKWQRLIAGSLSSISSGGEAQFLLASHSIEIIARYVDSSFELKG